jgi:hypothetical protein
VTLSDYLVLCLRITLANSLVFALVVAGALFAVGDTSVDMDANISFTRFEALWLLVLLPLLSLLLAVLLAPASFPLFRRIPGRH